MPPTVTENALRVSIPEAQLQAQLDANAPLLDLELLGRYRLCAELGRGASAVVYEAQDLTLQRSVALKLFEHTDDLSRRQRFLREVRSCAALRSPWVAEVYDAGFWQQRPFMVSERLRGCTLAEAFANELPSGPALAVEIVRQICWGIDAAHNAGFVHRDIKPQNVFLEEATPQPRVKLLDFGLAKLKGATELTEPGQVLGSLAYASPEQLRDASSVDERSDIYAIGVVLYQLLYGRLPHVAMTRREMELSIAHDEPDYPEGRGVTAELQSILRRALSKRAVERFASAAQFARALPTLAAPPYSPPKLAEPFAGTARLELLGRIGGGGDADVYSVVDRNTGELKAVKKMRRQHAGAHTRLRNEFRLLSSVAHDNIVRYDDLIPSPHGPLLLMERIDGVPCDQWARGSPARVLDVAKQLACALLTLHEQGIVHRDVKPANVLVTEAGRAVLIDFSLALPDGVTTAPSAGTPRFMAPEAGEAQVSPAGDMFAFGVLLRELALSSEGTRESSRPPDRIDEPAAPQRSSDAAGLSELSEALLNPVATRRPTARQVVERLDATNQARVSVPLSLPFVARERELSALDAWLLDEPASILHLVGPAGIGKSTLLRRWHERVRSWPTAPLLTASCRCRPSEGIPYPAAEELVQSLVAELCSWSVDTLRKTLPPLTSDLVRLSPAFAQLALVVGHAGSHANGAAAELTTPDSLPKQLGTLLRSISINRRVVLTVDDAQWLDRDSCAFLSFLLESAPDQVHLLLVSRDEISGSLDRFMASSPIVTHHMELSPLSVDACTAALHARLPETPRPLVRQIAAQSQGIPYLLDLILQEMARVPDTRSPDAVAALSHKITLLPAQQRRLLGLVAVSVGPLPQESLVVALGSDALKGAQSLVTMRLLRRTLLLTTPDGERLTSAFECYHDTVRCSVLASLSPNDKMDLHTQLAHTLRRQREPDIEAALTQLTLAGNADEVLLLVRQAAERSRGCAQFDRAAKLYTTALENNGLTNADRRSLLEARFEVELAGAALVAAADSKLQIARLSSPDEHRAQLVEAAELLLCAGEVHRGLDILTPMLDELGLRLPASEQEAIGAAVALLQEVVPLLAHVPEHPDPLPPANREYDRIDVALMLAAGLSYVDARFLYFLMVALREALDHGPSLRLQKALASFVAGTASHMPNPGVELALRACRRMTLSTPDPLARVLLYSAEAEAAHFEGRFLESESACESAERLLQDCRPTAYRELAQVRVRLVLLQYSQRGDYRSLVPRSLEWLRAADLRADAFSANWLRAAHALVWVAANDAEKARQELNRAEARWTGGIGVFDVATALYHDVIDRYTGCSSCAFEPAQGRAHVLQSPALQTPFLGGYVQIHRAWTALRQLTASPPDSPSQARAQVLDAIARLRATMLPSWAGAADALQANLEHIDGNEELGLALLASAENRLHASGLLSLAGCARHRRGELMGGELGERIRVTAAAQLRELGVALPERFCGAYWSPFAVSTSDERTIT